ncbi:aspartate/glutamate racemase family protein [Haloechinothrix sp. YIM 98757]|uniref:Aspartate/glutamate racemase family protein n=1 Tax=Haloechinothrix aidingensis TaxID=2752311 RepID=A0A838ACN9_9PSEU|nr:aspartate/glutamate racemase family protein [Haloechinothrix aidingensis]MBA0127046.1 aspartate/glutamate racemase family protein [Haloechinothrix aidingensis]
MRTIGLLGGMSWVSSAEYYRLLNERTSDVLGTPHSAPCVLYSVDFAEIERMQADGRWDEAAVLLGDAARAVRSAGAELLVLCTNTMHKVADEIQAVIDIPLLHLADVTARAVLDAGITRVGLLGTAYTMEQDYYRARVERHGLEVLVPGADDRATVHRIIFDELVNGTISEASRRTYQEIIAGLGEAGAEGVILGCTEIELLIGRSDSPLPTFPTTRLHVDAAIAAALDERTGAAQS